MTQPIILALDASTTAIGWCVGQGDQYLNSDTFEPPGDGVEARILAISRWVVHSVATYDPDIVAIENPMGHHGNLLTDRLLARTAGMIEGICKAMDPDIVIRTIYIHPMQVKRTPFHKNAIRAAAAFVGKDSVSVDEADAIGVWQVALGIVQQEAFNRRAEEEAP